MRLTRRLLALSAGAAALAVGFGALPLDASSARAAVGIDGRVGIAVVMPIVVPAAAGGIISADDLESWTAPDGLLTRDLDAVADQPVTLAIDPRILASIRVLGSSAPASAEQWLTRLGSLSNEMFPLAYADADVVGPIQAGTATRLQPTGFDDLIDASRFGSPTATPSPTPNPGDRPPLPDTLSDLIGWDWTVQSIAWPAAGTVTAADLPTLASQGYSTVLLDSGNLQGSASGRVSFSATPTLTGLVDDADLSEAVRVSAGMTGDPGFQAALPALTAAVTEAAADPGSPDRVVTLSRDSVRSVQHLPQTLAAIGALPNARLEGLTSVLQDTPSAAAIQDAPEDDARVDAIANAIRLEGLDTQFSPVAVDPADITDPVRRRLLALLSVQWLGDGDWDASVASYAKASRDLRNGVQLTQSSDAVAFGANAPLPVTVRNSLSVPVRVFAIARPKGLGLSIPPDKRRVEVTVQPDSSQTVRIPSQSVSNGGVDVEFSLQSVSGQQVGDPRVVRIDVQAGWETVGTLVAVVLVLGVFGFGITRRILRGRRTRKGGDGDAPTDPAPASPAATEGTPS